MLAEPRSKVKWTLNPRGNDWMKDESSFGKKMLEKMGWAPGKGLGAQEQGIKQMLSTRTQVDRTGLGQDRKRAHEWTRQQQDFDSLLSQLSGHDSAQVTISSLEQKSKATKTRVHYQKFTRGKDLSRYSAKDLACIVGGAGLVHPGPSPQPQPQPQPQTTSEKNKSNKRKRKLDEN